MPIYLLVPLHTGDPAWRGIMRRDPIQVIAENEREARAAAWLRYGAALRSEQDPWLLSRWVYAHMIEATDASLPILKWPERAGPVGETPRRDRVSPGA
jgi:hypothetical protein